MSKSMHSSNEKLSRIVEDILRMSDKDLYEGGGEVMRTLVLSVMELHKSVCLLRKEVQMLRWFIGTLIVMVIIAMVQTLFK